MNRPFGNANPFRNMRAVGGQGVPAAVVAAAFAPELNMSATQAATGAYGTITTPAKALIADQDYFALTDPAGIVTSFWFQTDGGDTENAASIALVAGGQPGSSSIEVDIQGATTATDVAVILETEINTAAIGITATNIAELVVLDVDTAGTAGSAWTLIEVVADAGFTIVDIANGQAANPAIADAGTHLVGVVPVALFQLTMVFTNAGSIALTITNPATIGDETNCTATIDTAPGTSVASGATTSTILDVTPTAPGAFSFTYSIANNDASENPYNFTVSGIAV